MVQWKERRIKSANRVHRLGGWFRLVSKCGIDGGDIPGISVLLPLSHFFLFMKRLASRKKPTGMKAFFFSLFGTYKACFFVLGRVASLCRAFVLFFFRVGAIRFHGQIALTPARSGCPTDLSSVPAAQVIKNRLLCFYSLHDYLW